MQIFVSAEHIDWGDEDRWSCPIHIAIWQQTGVRVEVNTNSFYVPITGRGGPAPLKCRHFTQKRDAGLIAKPFTFNLDDDLLPQEVKTECQQSMSDNHTSTKPHDSNGLTTKPSAVRFV